jgi:exodeoxyribonuclease III
MQWNANGIRARIKKGAFIRFLIEENPDVFMISDFRCDLATFFKKKGIKNTLDRLGYQYYVAHISSKNVGYGGVAIFSKIEPTAIGSGVGDPELDEEGRLAWMEFEQFRLFEVYSPNSGMPGNLRFLQKRIRFERAFNKRLRSLNDKPQLVCGDLNVVRREEDVYGGLSDPRWKNHPACTNVERTLLEELIDDNKLVDVQATLNIPGFSYFRSHRYEKRNEGMRIDYVLAPALWVENKFVTGFSVRRDIRGSDHIPHEFQLARSLFGLTQNKEALASIEEQPPLDKLTSPFAQAMHDALTDRPFETLFSIREDDVDLEPEQREENEQTIHWSNFEQWFNEMGYGSRSEPNGKQFIEEVHNVGGTSKSTIILPTVDVTIKAGKGTPQVFRALVDSGASSSIANYEMLAELLGTEKMEASLMIDGYLPQFRCADGRTTRPTGRIVLRFSLKGQKFQHTFYVMKSCAHPLILGGDFMAATDTVISYKKGHIKFTSDEGVRVSCAFDTHKGERAVGQRAATLFATAACVIPPQHSIRIDAKSMPGDPIQSQRPWGFCETHELGGKLAVPRSCTRLEGGKTMLVVSNLDARESIVVRAGQAVAMFVEANRDEYEEHAVDLEKLGIDENPFRELVRNTVEPKEQDTERAEAKETDRESSRVARQVRSTTPTQLNTDSMSKSHACESESGTTKDTREQTSGLHLSSLTSLDEHNGCQSVRCESGVRRNREVVCESEIPTQEDSGRREDASWAPVDRGNMPTEPDEAKHCRTKENDAAPFEWVASACVDKYEPFEKDDVDSVHLPRIPRDQIDEMTEQEVEQFFNEAPLNRIKIREDLSKDQRLALRKTILSHRDLFAKNDKVPGTVNAAGCSITVQPGAKPQCFPIRPTLPNVRPLLEKHIEELLQHGIIEHSHSPWGAAVLLIPKKDPTETRFCVDLRLLNKVTIRDAYPLPRIDDALSSLAGNCYFSALDAVAGYWQVPMASEEDREKTAFRCSLGHFQFRKMPMGLCNAGAAFQRYMDAALAGLTFQCALVYLDDILVMSATFEGHLGDLDKVCNALRAFGLHLKAKKCTFAAAEVRYLGHIVSSHGVAPDPEKVRVIAETNPSSRDEIRSFCGVAGYYRRYVRDFAKVTKPLTAFINSRKPWAGLTPDMQEAIDKIKVALTSEPILGHPDFNEKFEIQCDASPSAIAATLTQRTGNTERVIMYASRCLKKHERNYHQYEREALAVVWAVAVFRAYTFGRPFRVVTDNKAVTQIFSRPHSSRLIRWVLGLQEHDIEYVQRAASKHANVDGLSRCCHIPCDTSFTKGDNIEALQCEECVSSFEESEKYCLSCKGTGPCECTQTHIPRADPIGTREGRELFQTAQAFLEEPDNIEDDMLPSLEELIRAQQEDPDLKRHIEHMEQEDDTRKKHHTHFFMKNGVLMRSTSVPMRFRKRSRRTSERKEQICVPKKMRRAVLLSVHGLPCSGHDGVLRTHLRLREHFWWKHYEKDCTAWVRSCLFCQKRKTSKPHRNGLSQPLLAARPFHWAAFDIIGPLPETEEGYKYVLTVIDHFSRYPLAIPIASRRQDAVVHALHRHLVCVFGPPMLLLSDLEKSFVSKVTKGLLAKMGITKLDTSGYQPQANGCVERFHRYLNATLTMFVNSHKNDWADYIDSVLYAYRTSVCTSTGYSPFQLMFGRKARMPPDLLYTADPHLLEEEGKRNITVSESMKEAYRFARRRQLKVATANKERRDKGRKNIRFDPGDLVLFVDKTADKEGPGKFQFVFSGPHLVIKKDAQSPNLYHVQMDKTKTIRKLNVNRLVLMDGNNRDLGPPLGSHKADNARETTQNDGRDGTHANQPLETYKVGNLVALLVAPDSVENMPFAVGEIISLQIDGSMTVWWYGNGRGNVRGAWRTGYYQATSDQRRYYDDRRLHPQHKRYTSATSSTTLDGSDIVGEAFELTKGRNIPMKILNILSKHPDVPWKLPEEEQANVYSLYR